MKKRWWTKANTVRMLVVLSSIGVIAAAIFLAWREDREPLTMVKGTNTNAAIYADHVLRRQLKNKYPVIHRALPEDSTGYVIPGLLQTKTLVAKGEKKGRVGYSRAMDPQGLAVSDYYVLISAYSKGGGYNSVIYVLNRETGNYVKTIVLKGTPHAGGLAYDPESDLVWVATESPKGGAQLSAFSIDSLEEYDFDEEERPIEYDYQIDLKDIKKASFLAYYENALYVGYFHVREPGSLVCYPLREDGFPDTEEGTREKLRSKAADYSSYVTYSQLQGLAFYRDLLLFSRSYGPKKSKLLTYRYVSREEWVDFYRYDRMERIIFPPYMEQVVCVDDTLYALFESPAYAYRRSNSIVQVDRVLKLDLHQLLGLDPEGEAVEGIPVG